MVVSPVYCLHCGLLQEAAEAQLSEGPHCIKLYFMCPGCGWWVDARAMTMEFVIQQIDYRGTGNGP